MTQEKVDALNSIEFIWVAKNVGDETQTVGYVEKKESDCSAENEGVGADVQKRLLNNDLHLNRFVNESDL